MPRPPLPIGTYGKIRFYETGSGWRAVTKFRDFDGVTRPVERSGRTKAAAERILKKALAERNKARAGASIKPATKFREVAAFWLAEVRKKVEAGTRSPSTLEQYESNLNLHVLPALGELRVGQEVSVPAAEAFLQALRSNKGLAVTKTARSVASGVMGYAVTHGALEFNPFRQTSRLEKRRRRKRVRALTLDERVQWLDQLEADAKAVRWDLPDLSRFMLATGVRIGEALAVDWSEVDLDDGLVAVDYTVVRVKGKGLIRKSTKTEYGERTLPLCSWALEMLRRRYEEAGCPATGPVFPDSLGGLRDPSNTRRVLRETRGSEGFAWVTSHVFRKTSATILDEAGLTARVIADQLGHSRPSMTQDVYMGRKAVSRQTAAALETALTEA
ncbi:Site-specific recombinase XerD [Saccharopolyspora kobensis]|uniref:Site-specific recombinase XerD n=1 Tax=Saccharopolyspora kobensis TaxID=146035 RepID=A0A1H6DZ47_9PSEU|nr:site-specific integrase [Saccharopolyspora kobensis]SEG90612.1 Site-specific recombinase XerD [Saccharopolyspora kobensis]SFD92565.1 Site-specific recombinase XerD [Saccharopolyspora kobensis]